jgi:hypothetical protein
MPLARIIVPKLLLVALLLVAAPAAAGSDRFLGQTLYIPAYSHIAYGSGKSFMPLRITLSLRNLSRTSPVTFIRVDYHDGEGRLVTEKLDQPIVLAPLATRELAVIGSEVSGGASFIVEWTAAQPVDPPLVKSIMIGTSGPHGISFVGNSRVLDEVGP